MFNFSLDQETKADAFERINKWDLLIVGGGPAGLNAALYAKRKGLEVGLVADELGGQLHNTSLVDNYLGINAIQGADLSRVFVEHLKALDVPILKGVRVKKIATHGPDYTIHVSNGKEYLTKTVLLTTGGTSRKLGIPGEDEFANKGVTYCATCDGPFFKDKHVVVAGGGNSAVEGVLDMVPWASEITLVHRSQFRADKILIDQLDAVKGLDIYLETQILSVIGNDKMTGIQVLDKQTNEKRVIQADGLLIEIGTIPNSDLVRDLVETNASGEVLVDAHQMTSLPGLFAAGDVTEQPFKQIVIAVAEGAKAALAISQYLKQNYKGEK